MQNNIQNTPMVVGVSGVLGSGKSTFCRHLRDEYGFHWIEADAITRDLYMIDAPGYRKIREYFGKEFVGKNGVNRGRLRRFILKTPHKLWILNKLLHPLIANEVNKKIIQMLKLKKDLNKKEDLKICLEAFYFEPGDLGQFITKLVIVDAPDAVLIRRLRTRKIPISQLRTLIKFQRKNLPKGGKKIVNDGSIKSLWELVKRFSVVSPRSQQETVRQYLGP